MAGLDEWSEQGLYEDLALGFRLGNTPAEAGCPSELVGTVDLHAGVNDAIDRLVEGTAEAFGCGAALELTGGVDSRLVLALGLAGGERPRLAMTIATDQQSDTTVAATIAERLDIPHRVLPQTIQRERLYDDARTFVRASGGLCNAVAYAWLPNIFRQLEDVRVAQVSGNGGEYGTTFYSTPLDRWANRRLVRHVLIRHRVLRPQRVTESLFRPAVARECRQRTRQRLDALLGVDEGPWVDVARRLYLQRLRGWAIPTLQASSHWYTVYAPLLSPDYLRWCDAIPVHKLSGRRAQWDLIRRLAPELVDLPLACHTATTTASRSAGWRPFAKKVARRVVRRKDATPLGAAEVALALSTDFVAVNDLLDFGRMHEEALRLDFIEHMLENPARYAYEVGALWSSAIMWSSSASSPTEG